MSRYPERLRPLVAAISVMCSACDAVGPEDTEEKDRRASPTNEELPLTDFVIRSVPAPPFHVFVEAYQQIQAANPQLDENGTDHVRFAERRSWRRISPCVLEYPARPQLWNYLGGPLRERARVINTSGY